jgi:tight adherence protein B
VGPVIGPVAVALEPGWGSGLVEGRSLLAAGCGAGIGLGLVLIAVGLGRRGATDGSATDPSATDRGPAELDGNGSGPKPRGWLALLNRWRAGWGTPRLVGALGAGLVAGTFTRWLVAAILTALGVWAAHRLWFSDPSGRERVARIEAIASWTEMLRDTLGAAAGLEQAITATAGIAPAAIRDEVRALADQITRGRRLTPALRDFAAELDDPTGDLVVVALILASEHQARHLADLLAGLAVAAREQVGMRLRVTAGRARTQTSVRTIVAVTLAMAVGLVLLDRDYLSAYDSPAGQLVLLVVGCVFAGGLAWITRIARVPEPARVLTRLNGVDAPAVWATGGDGEVR